MDSVEQLADQRVGAMKQKLDAMEQRAEAMEQQVVAMKQQVVVMKQQVGSLEQRLVEAERTVERLSLSKRDIRQAQPSQVKADSNNANAPVDPPITRQADDQPTDDAAPHPLKKQALSDDRVE
ncbi:hypothetical protein H4S07_000749 [Coemansia furcata]|uniref:Uncharacterized protein n=1 Tax=Coemansia furcata TaxID=417177 RepID=A0ACC1LPV3_9FUNG|nr:hypothetical protein H4S07_000749 [Coemansia furcata]